MNNPFRNLVKKPAKHEKGEIVVADSGNVKEVAKIMIGFEALLRETQSYMSKACGNKLFDSDLKDAMRQLIKQYMKDHNYYVPHMNLAEAADRLYVEMAEYSFLTPLLARKDIEEININSWDDIQSIYRMDSNNYEQLKQAYSYAKKAHCDGDNRIQAKSALTSSVICSLLSNIRDISSTEIAEYENKAIEYAYAAITSDYFKRLPQKLEDEFEKKRSRSKGYSFYKRLSDICEKRILNCSDELSKKILEINKALKDSERSPVKI